MEDIEKIISEMSMKDAKEELLAYIRKFMESSDEKELRQYRERVTRAFR